MNTIKNTCLFTLIALAVLFFPAKSWAITPKVVDEKNEVSARLLKATLEAFAEASAEYSGGLVATLPGSTLPRFRP